MKIKKALIQDRQLVEDLMQVYLHEMSEFDTAIVPDSQGRFDYGEYFSLYWSEQSRYPYLLFHDDRAIGFALVRQLEANIFSIAEFFVMPAFRRKGRAKFFAKSIFDQHPGRWQVAELENNITAQKFWRVTIHEYTQGNFSDEWSEQGPRGPMQVFNSSFIKDN